MGLLLSLDTVDEASLESFPASDPPGWIAAHAGECPPVDKKRRRRVRTRVVGTQAAYYARTRALYDSWYARLYDVVTWFLRPVRRRVAALADLRPGARVLDVATGTGAQARAFADRGAHVVAADLAPRMLEVARRHCQGRSLELVEADATVLPWDDGSFDVGSVSFALHEMPAAIRQRAVQELARVTRPGGKVIVVEHALPRNRAWAWLLHRVLRPFEPTDYRDLLRSSLAMLLADAGLTVQSQHRLLLDSVQVVTAVKDDDSDA